jgi:hypothetical protein
VRSEPGARENRPGEAHRAAPPSRQHSIPGIRRGGPARRPPLCSPARRAPDVCECSEAAIYALSANGKEDFHMPTWVWILLIVLLVLVLFGGVGYGRRGV